MSEQIYEAQEQINPTNIREKTLAMAKDAGLNEKKFETCYDKQESKPQVEADIAEAKTLGVNSTPTFYITDARRPASGTSRR